MRLTGWTTEVPVIKLGPSAWDDGTHFLGEEWDMIPHFPIGYAPGRIRHYADWAYRRRKFDMRTDLADLEGARLRSLLGHIERRSRPLYWPITGVLRYRLGQITRLSGAWGRHPRSSDS